MKTVYRNTRHSNMLAWLYTPEGENMVNQRNAEAIKKVMRQEKSVTT